jgi:hypothetical protein
MANDIANLGDTLDRDRAAVVSSAMMMPLAIGFNQNHSRFRSRK